MATTTKKTVSKTKATTTENIAENINDTERDVEIKETIQEEIKEAVKEIIKESVKDTEKEKSFTDSDYILCRSVWSGGLNVDSQSGNIYRFKDYGDECEINYRDLVTLIRRGSDHVFMPRFIILDEEFLKDFPTVQRVYGSMYTRTDLINILDLPLTQMKREIEKLPVATKNSMRNLVSTQIANGKLDSISKVRALTEIFNSDFNLLSDLFIK